MAASSYRETAVSRIDEILAWNYIAQREDVLKLDPAARKLLKKDLETNCPFQRRGTPYRIWQSELKILFGLSALTGQPPPAALTDDQRGLLE